MQTSIKLAVSTLFVLMIWPVLGFSQDAKMIIDQLFPARASGMIQTSANWNYNQQRLQTDLEIVDGSMPMLSKISYYGNQGRVVAMELLFADNYYIDLAAKYHVNKSISRNQILLRMSRTLMGINSMEEVMAFQNEEGVYGGFISNEMIAKAVYYVFLSDQSVLLVSSEVRNSSERDSAIEMVKNFTQAINRDRMSEALRGANDYYEVYFNILERLTGLTTLPVQSIFSEEMNRDNKNQLYEIQVIYANDKSEVDKRDGNTITLMANVACHRSQFDSRSQIAGIVEMFDGQNAVELDNTGWKQYRLEDAPGTDMHLVYQTNGEKNLLYMTPVTAMSLQELEQSINVNRVLGLGEITMPCN